MGRSVPRNPDPLGELFDRIRDAASGWAQDFIEDTTRRMQPPRAQRQRRVSGKAPKVKRAKFMGPTAYDVLEVSPRASQETITAAYRSLAKRFHPDGKHGGELERCKKRMVELNVCYAEIGDPAKRREYDKRMREGR
jgi:DnaJ-class molecular chaperone